MHPTQFRNNSLSLRRIKIAPNYPQTSSCHRWLFFMLSDHSLNSLSPHPSLFLIHAPILAATSLAIDALPQIYRYAFCSSNSLTTSSSLSSTRSWTYDFPSGDRENAVTTSMLYSRLEALAARPGTRNPLQSDSQRKEGSLQLPAQ